MLTVYRSNRADLLARLLAAQLQLHPPDPWETVAVVVNTWPTSRWLGEELAVHLGGIAANLRFPFPASTLRAIVEGLLQQPHPVARVALSRAQQGPSTAAATARGREATAAQPSNLPQALEQLCRDPWRAERLVWPVLDLLPAVAAGPHGALLLQWLQDRRLGPELDLASWQLGRAIADALDDYALYRPDVLLQWEQPEGAHPVPEGHRWQRELYRALRQRLEPPPFGLRVLEAIERLEAGQAPPAWLGSCLRLFGLSSLAPVQVRLLEALGRRLPVELYLLTPCPDLWQRAADRRRQLSDALALALPLEGDWLLQAPGLEARFGRLGAEFQQLLEGSGAVQDGQWQDHDLFLNPTQLVPSCPGTGKPPLLAQLQEHLILGRDAPPLALDPEDHSLEFHACGGALRQVQIVRDRLLQLLAADETLEPRHILVMTPQVEELAPLLASVFGDPDATGVDLPWRLTDRSQQGQAGIGQTLLQLLRLAGERLTATALEPVLACAPLQERFALSAEELAPLPEVLQRCGFRWGLDGQERGGDPCHSLSWAIDRLVLGLVLPAEPGLAPADTAPFAAGSPERTGRWLHLLARLQHWLHDCRRPVSPAAWAQRLRDLLADLFAEGGSQAWAMPPLLAAIEDWQQVAGTSTLQLEAAVVAAVLEERLSQDSGRFGHRSGALTISALEPMRAIPHRVVVLLGLDAAVFPRQRSRPGFHLLDQQRRLGDPHPADQDRYVLLEALLSARQHLLITWSNRDERRGEERQPAGPVRQWLQWLQAGLGPQARQVLVEHPVPALDRRNFLPQAGRPPASCDQRLLQTRQLLDAGPPPPTAPLVQGPMPTRLPAGNTTDADLFTDLQTWAGEPQKRWLADLGLRPGERDTLLDDLEALALPEWQRQQQLRQRWQEQQQELLSGLWPSPELEASVWHDRCRGQGLLPPAAAAVLEARTLQQRWSSLNRCLEALGPAAVQALHWKGWQCEVLWAGRQLVLVHLGRPQPSDCITLWLQLLVAAAAEREPLGAVLVGRDENQLTVQRQLRVPDPQTARLELERLQELRQRWRTACWPVPPRTGWTYLEQERARPGSGLRQAEEVWLGGRGRFGERERPEMVVCFGAQLPAEQLLQPPFALLAAELYGPLLEASC